jgi:hypothetical protein
LTNISEVLTASIIRAMMMETVSTSKTSVNFYQTTWRNIPEDSHLPDPNFRLVKTDALHRAATVFGHLR